MRKKEKKAIDEIKNLEERLDNLPDLELESNSKSTSRILRIEGKKKENASKTEGNNRRVFVLRKISFIVILISILAVILVSFFIKSKEVNNYSTVSAIRNPLFSFNCKLFR